MEAGPVGAGPDRVDSERAHSGAQTRGSGLAAAECAARGAGAMLSA